MPFISVMQSRIFSIITWMKSSFIMYFITFHIIINVENNYAA